MPVIPSSQAGQARGRAPTTFDKWKMGAMLGGSVGLIMGFGYGFFTIMRYGAGPRGPLRTLTQYMLGSGATFGFFMSIGSIIRTEPVDTNVTDIYRQAARKPLIVQRRFSHFQKPRKEALA